nr:hypothetical protein [Tanacetum cinerariifolium]
MQTQTSNTLHNAIMDAGGKDRPPMLAPSNYVQWNSRIKRYIDTKPNHELIYYCLKNPPYKFTWADKEVPISKGSPVKITKTYMETYKNVSQDIRDQLNAEAEEVQIILTGIDNDIYSTVDACPNAYEMWKAIARLKQGESINVQDLKTNLYWEYGKFTSQDGETLESLQQVATRKKRKAIINSPQPIYDQEPSIVAKDDEMSKDKEIDKLMALISLSSTGYENQQIGNVAGARETVGSTVVQKSGIQCYNCKEFGHVARECQKPKRVKDAAYHKEKMLLCKQEEAGIQLNAEQADWRDNTDDESEDQELEAHYMYMAQIQEVSPDADDSGPIFDYEPVQKVSTDDHYNVFTIESEHLEQSESVHDTYPIDQDKHNVIIDSLDMSYDREQIDQNDDDDNDLANKLEKLKGEIEDFKNKNKSLKSSNNRFKEANNKLSETNKLLYNDFKKSHVKLQRCNDVEYASKVEIDCAKAKGDLISYKMESQKSFNKYTQTINDLNQTILKMKKKLCAHQETISILSQAKEAQFKLYKTREDKELVKVIALENKVKVLDNIVYKSGQSVQTMNMLNNKCQTSFAKPEFLKKAKRVNLVHKVTSLKCDYLELLEKCKCIEKELSKSQMMSKNFEALQKHAINLEIDLQQCQKKIKMIKSFKENQLKEFCKEHEQYFEIDDLKAQLQDKGIVISELKKLIEKLKGKSMDTKFEKSSVIRQPNAFNSHRPLILGKLTIFSDSLKRKDFSKSKSVTQNNVSNDFSKPVTAQTLPPNKKSIIKNTNVLAPGMYKLHTKPTQTRTSQLPQDSRKTNKREVEDQHRNVKLSKNKTSVTACNDSLNAKTLNVNFVCATCGKYVLNEKHDMCVFKSINVVNSRTKIPIFVPVSTREPKRTVKLSAAKPIKKTVASESNQKPRNITRNLYERISKACSWWYPKFKPSGYKWKLKSEKENVNTNLVEIVLFIVDFGCSKHMTGNLKLLINFVEKFLGTVKFGNDQIAPILGYEDLVQGAITIKRVYYVEGLNHNLFSVGQFCDADLEVAFRKSTCYIRDLKGNDLLKGSRGTDLYLIILQDINSPNPISLMAKATSSQAGLWHRRLSHLNFNTINLLSKNDIVVGLPKLKFVKDHLCSFIHLDSFLRSKDETPEVLVDFLRLVQRGLHAQVRIVQIDKGTEFLNKTFHAYFPSKGILHQMSVARTPEQNNVVERRNRTLVEAARTMPSAAKEKGDACIFVGYSTQSRAYRVFNKRIRVIVETIHVNFDELPLMASDHVSSYPGPQCQRTGNDLLIGSRGTDLYSITLQDTSSPNSICLMAKATSSQACPMFDELLNGSSKVVSKSFVVSTVDAHNQRQHHTTPLNTHTTPAPTCQVPTQAPIAASPENMNQQKWLKNMIKLKMTSLSTSSVHQDGENLDKIKGKGDACIFVGYSTHSKAYRVFNKRTRVIVETIHVNFDELPQMASNHVSSDPAPECQRMALEHDSLSPGSQCQENVSQVDKTVTTSNKLDLLFSPMFDELLNGSSKNINQAEMVEENAQVENDEFINIFCTSVQDRGKTTSRQVDSSNMHTFYQRHPFEHRWTKDHPLEQVIKNPYPSVRTRR